MPELTFFQQECPRCGRLLHIRVEYLGRQVICQHCRGALTAADPEGAGAVPTAAMELLRRADELLDLVEQRKLRPR
jgi:hypothetical protein